MWILGIAILIAAAVLIYVRVAPHDVSRWHRSAAVEDLGETRLDGGYVWREKAGPDAQARLARLDEIIRAHPRTKHLAGSVADGQVTYVSRTKWVGFPDYTTIGLYGDAPQILEVYGRLRFGRSDFGVNAGRIKGWLAQLG